jgi:glycosyltransferase involved in cell wall biosynthesis
MAISQYGNANDFAALKGMITYNAIAKAMSGTSFYVIGGADKQLRDTCNNLIFTGCLEHYKVQELLNQSKVYCQLSYTESFGVALLEAIQLGCIPVVTDKDGMAEIVQNCGHKILYGDVECGINAVKQSMVDNRDRSEIILNSRDKYSKEHRRLDFINVINEVMHGN